jgi:2-oxoglutarate ferredoxin oxidoreductase subunit alpha
VYIKLENTKRNEISIRVSGENGDGIFSVGDLLAKICSRMGLHVHGSRTYQSIIRGGHVSYSVRASNNPVRAPADYIDLLIALRADSFVVDAVPMVRKGGIVLYDSVGMKITNPPTPENFKLIDVPAVELAKSVDKSLKILMNTIFVGVALYVYNMHRDSIYELLEEQFGSKGEEVVSINKKAIDTGYDWAKEHCEQIENDVDYSSKKKSVYIGGNEILSYGLLNGGLQSYAWYPMTPATPVGAFLAEYGPDVGCMVKQMEDEINVANYAVGAGFAGARSACGTSGGGFALMTETIGFASIIEAPVVYIEVARGGPSTGLPTKTEQGDLNQLLGASQGDYPRAILAQVSIEDGFYLAQEALNIADKYQMPVLISSDLYMGEHFETIPELDYDRIPINRGKLITEEVPESDLPYLRYKVTEDGISPRTIPGVANGMYIAGSDEHDESGVLISDRRAGFPEMLEVRKSQMHKRMKKMDLLLKELPAPTVEGHNSSEAKILFVGWGSTLDTIRESRQQLEKAGVKTAQLHIKYVLPFQSKEVGAILNEYNSKGVKILMVEGNYTGQMARHIRGETGFEIKDKYLRFDGEYILPRDITAFVQENYKF